MKAIYSGKAKNDQIDSQKIAHLRRACAAPPPSLALTGEPQGLSHPFEEDGTRAQRHV
jgi:hypothetical protein